IFPVVPACRRRRRTLHVQLEGPRRGGRTLLHYDRPRHQHGIPPSAHAPVVQGPAVAGIPDRKSTRLNSVTPIFRMPASAWKKKKIKEEQIGELDNDLDPDASSLGVCVS